jgi:hypothetical protein
MSNIYPEEVFPTGLMSVEQQQKEESPTSLDQFFLEDREGNGASGSRGNNRLQVEECDGHDDDDDVDNMTQVTHSTHATHKAVRDKVQVRL